MALSEIRVKQIKVFLQTFFIYASAHCLRTTWSSVKTSIYSDPWFPIDEKFIGTLDVAFLFPYAISMIFLGRYGDRIDLRYFISIGLLGGSFFFTLFGLVRSFAIHSLVLLILFQMLNGIFQSVLWPGCIAVLGNWLGKEKKGLVMVFKFFRLVFLP